MSDLPCGINNAALHIDNLGRFLFRFLGAWQVAVAERAAGCGCKHTDVRAVISETRGSLEDSGGCLVAPGRAGAAPDP
ncbi:hypothetical protein NDU88_002323 [Pleurodeles waltl]|uniref:Uncharacterized protein n=1 Tax=Pleurodeles waltl TaxID=8319 RepID=A0AAV7SCX6_PLEWA|nr:hypothetical protein NDU88_002323 [Pleurodeles waltl]